MREKLNHDISKNKKLYLSKLWFANRLKHETYQKVENTEAQHLESDASVAMIIEPVQNLDAQTETIQMSHF